MKLLELYVLASTYTLLSTFDFDTPALFSGYLFMWKRETRGTIPLHRDGTESAADQNDGIFLGDWH